MPRKTNYSDTYGTIKQKTVTSDGKKYTYWMCRVYFTDPDTGRKKEKTLSGNSKHEVQEKLYALISSGQSIGNQIPSLQRIPSSSELALEEPIPSSSEPTLEASNPSSSEPTLEASNPSSSEQTLEESIPSSSEQTLEESIPSSSELTLEEWIKEWETEFLSGVSAGTARNYKNDMRLYVIPALGSVPLSQITREQIRNLYKALSKQKKQNGKGFLSYKTRRDIAGAFHKALETAVEEEKIPTNPAIKCVVPKSTSSTSYQEEEMHPLKKTQLADFLHEIKYKTHEHLFDPYRV